MNDDKINQKITNIPMPTAYSNPPTKSITSILRPQYDNESIPINLPKKDPKSLAISPIQSQKAKWQNSSIPKGLKKVCAKMYTAVTVHIFKREVLTSLLTASAI